MVIVTWRTGMPQPRELVIRRPVFIWQAKRIKSFFGCSLTSRVEINESKLPQDRIEIRNPRFARFDLFKPESEELGQSYKITLSSSIKSPEPCFLTSPVVSYNLFSIAERFLSRIQTRNRQFLSKETFICSPPAGYLHGNGVKWW
jgi:hypothetical protein